MSSAPSEAIEQLFLDHGVSSEGFKRPHIDEIWEVAVREAEQKFGRTLTAPTSSELQYVELVVLWADTFFEMMESVYYSSYYRTAQGKQLDRLLALMGYERLPERQATGEVTFTAAGSNGAPERVDIPAGTRITTSLTNTEERKIFETTEPAVIPEGATEVTQVPVRGVDPLLTSLDLSDTQTGEETNVATAALDSLFDSVQGVRSVSNPLPTGGSGTRADDSSYDFVTGRDEESDADFRRRYESAQALGGSATLDSIEAAIRNAGDGSIVEAVRVDETLEITSDGSGGYTGRQIEPIVALKNDTPANRQAVGQAIFDSRAAGIESVGPVSVQAERSDGTTHNQAEGFRLTTDVEIYVEASILTTDTFPEDGVERIKQNVIEIVGGYLADGSRVSGEYGEIGPDVYYSQIVGAIMDNDVEGVLDVDGSSVSDAIKIGTADPPTGTSNVSISETEIALTRPNSITINTSSGSPQ
ncbi:baseplate J/gp47 family protein [Halocatena halophila]|uniref:baseplate J/gp47 family protein n=1 Tax=Halocatena halophila TaxID=2814576 RepID=UPI002ED5CC7B